MAFLRKARLVVPNRVSRFNLALVSHHLKKPSFKLFLIKNNQNNLILCTKFGRLALETNIMFSLFPSGQSIFHLGLPQLPMQVAPGLPILSVYLLLWKDPFFECSDFHLEKAIYIYLCIYIHTHTCAHIYIGWVKQL